MSNSVNHVSIVFPVDDQPVENKNKCHGCLSIIQEFSQNTTAHGLPGIVRSQSIHNRVYWSIALISFTGFMIYLIIQAVLNYFQYPTYMALSIDSEWPQYFPAFSLCNFGAIRLDQLAKPLLNYTNTLNLTNTNDTTTLFPDQLYSFINFVRDTLNSNGSMEPFMFSLSSMLSSCFYNSIPCSYTDFTPFITSAYGLCYTFNAKLKNQSEDSMLYGNEYGGVGKLELGLYVHSHQYIPHFIDSVGAVVIIHDNRDVPLVDVSSYFLNPGQKHILSFQKKTTFFLSSPYTSCSNKISPIMHATFDNYRNADYKYSETICFRLSVQIYTYQQCGCINPSIWEIRSIVLPGSSTVFQAPLCSTFDKCYGNALDVFLNSTSDSNDGSSDCPKECSSIEFIIKKSSLLAPVEWQMSSIKTFVENSSVPLPIDWSDAWREHIHRNYLAVTVVRETRFVENNTQTASTSAIDLLSNIGGQTGLWIGISLLSIMELFEMLYRLVRYAFHTIRITCQTKQ